MELFIITIIVVLAAGYTFRNFYNKFKTGKAKDHSCGCSSCCLNDTACGEAANTKPDNYFSLN